jgi:CDP-diacylglycerol--glycerol-3-phosphate 3-phosphatidyltransferase
VNLANKLTIARMCLIPLVFLALQPYPAWLAEHLRLFAFLEDYGTYIAAGLFLLAAATDKLDGYIARKYKLITNFGKLMDPLADKLLISVALLMLVQLHQIPAWAAVAIIGREIFVTGIRILASAQKTALAADRLGKIKMVLQVAAITAILLNNYPVAMFTSFRLDITLLYAAVMMTIYSGYRYYRNTTPQLKIRIR